MNLYVDLMTKVVGYIEDNITEPLGLEGVSKQFHLSEFHFDRLFKAVVGKSLKQYILGRKLTLAAARLKNTDSAIIDIAIDYGFEYPEVFSRAFKKHFGVSPKTFREEKPSVKVDGRVSVVPRNIVTFKGSITLKASYIYIETLDLAGLSVDVDVNAPNFRPVLEAASERVLNETYNMEHLSHDKFYSLVNCHGDDSGTYTVFSGKEVIKKDAQNSLEARTIPGGWYASFIYEGDMYNIRDTFVDDLYRWIAVKEIEVNSNGIGMVSIFDEDYVKNQTVKIWIPVKKPKT